MGEVVCTFGGALEARKVNASEGRLKSKPAGEVENDREAVQCAFERHTPYCPVYRSIGAAIEITTARQLVGAR